MVPVAGLVGSRAPRLPPSRRGALCYLIELDLACELLLGETGAFAVLP